MRQTLSVEVKNYNIVISDDKLEKLFEELKILTTGQKCLYVFSKRVYKLYKSEISIPQEQILLISDGETEKNINNYLKILAKATEIGLTRKDAIIAIGGGVIGDIVGFAASTYMRGIDYIQVPTTLLAMVDSSVGGKTAIDMFGIKNIIGTFYQPKAVFINMNFLKTLENRQFLSGIGEIIKYAFIESSCGYKHSLFLFEYLTLCCEKLLEREPMTLMRVIEYCLSLKIAVVEEDEKESGLRQILNLGHTLGHALEGAGKYKKYTHGEAVVQGIFFILDYAYSNGYISYSYYRLSLELLGKYGFKKVAIKYSPQFLLEYMKKDKKAESENIVFIVPCDKKKVKNIKLTSDEVLQALQVK